MTETYEYVLQKKHRAFRKEVTEDFAAEFSAGKLPLAERIVRRFERLAAAEKPHILPGEQIVFLRTTGKAGDVMTEEEWEEIGQYALVAHRPEEILIKSGETV